MVNDMLVNRVETKGNYTLDNDNVLHYINGEWITVHLTDEQIDQWNNNTLDYSSLEWD